jgi:hypothetical protein
MSGGLTSYPAVALLKKSLLGLNDLIKDAWGRQKVVIDFSLFHGVWTYDVPDRLWEEQSIAGSTYTPLTATGTLATSVDNMLEVSSGIVANNGTVLFSKRNPRYQPNRGHLYSTSVVLPNAIYDGRRKFGLDRNGNGVYFELEGDGAAWDLFVVRKSNAVVELRQSIKTLLPSSYDPEKNHVYDIQYQWRGAGDYFFYVDLKQIYVNEVLGTGTGLTLRMPALPVYFEAFADSTDELIIKAGCVDITSEGGKREGRLFASISTGVTLLSTDSSGVAMVGIKIPRTLTYGGGTTENTRDLIASKITSWTRDEAAVQVYFARDVVATALDALTWLSLPDSTSQYLIGGQSSALDTAFNTDKASMQLVVNEWNDAEIKNTVINPDMDSAPFYVTPGDILIIAVQSLAGTDDNATTLYLSEEV